MAPSRGPPPLLSAGDLLDALTRHAEGTGDGGERLSAVPRCHDRLTKILAGVPESLLRATNPPRRLRNFVERSRSHLVLVVGGERKLPYPHKGVVTLDRVLPEA